ncbi:hypothetical protein [Cupriavidus alkaliphilus]|uniref:hypothetical protein n=1 Tax=Cupriavidus alkaliphilus TaxID=942866 RepID=UPI000815D14F|nr:hypothetical protein [Cupriavidus alkaliphilus]SCB10163.1 hypothetical protein GA0116996_101627 [Cupriavidus alkaliphilus]
MALPEIPIDGNWVDIGSLISGFVYLFYRKLRRWDHQRFFSKTTGMDFANGAALFPLSILALSVLSSKLIQGIVEASKMSLSVAGIFALLAILDESDDAQSARQLY